MDGNKDEALRCTNIAKEAIAAGNKPRALKFIGIAKRLNSSLVLNDLLSEAENIDSSSAGQSNDDKNAYKVRDDGEGLSNGNGKRVLNEERNYTEEHVYLVKQIKTKKDYYAILGVEKSCSVEEIRKAYRKLSLKVHPDKNKAPGSEEAFKKVSKAFKCLSEDDSRRQYDQTGLVDEFEHNQQYTGTRRRRRNDFYDAEFDPDEVFRAFFGGRHDPFRNAHVYRTRTTHAHNHQREDMAGGPNFMLLLQLLPFLIIVLLAYLPFSEPEYSLQKNYTYQFKKTTEKHGVDYFVKSPAFDENYPIGGPDRHSIENNVIKDYKQMLVRYCHMEMQRRHWNRNFPTPHCDKLESFAA